MAPSTRKLPTESDNWSFDDRITASEILSSWNLNTDLVVLSACSSGLGPYRMGEGYLGFSQALFVAGSDSVILTLWDVDDVASALLIRRFYQNLFSSKKAGQTHSKATALHEAKSWLRNLTKDQLSKFLNEFPNHQIGSVRNKNLVSRSKKSLSAKPFAHPMYWAGFVLIGER